MSAIFAYDPLGRRVIFVKNGQTKTYLYDGLDMLKDGSSTFLNGVGIDEPLTISNGSTTQTYLGDHLGSVDWLSDVNGAFQTRYDYSSYGRLEGSLPNPSSTNSLTYTGREDDGTGLMYYRARYYDAGLERFISDDPLGDAQRYVGGNPLSWVDPLGLDYMSFDGRRLRVFSDQGSLKKSIPASSGKKGYSSPEYQSIPNKGPTPEGRYWFNRKDTGYNYWGLKNYFKNSNWSPAWGQFRVRLNPYPRTNTYGRREMYLHGSWNGPGSLGCIDVMNFENEIMDALKNSSTNIIDVFVDYSEPDTSPRKPHLLP